MFVNLMRVNQRWLMILISVPVIISFLWYLNNSTHTDRAVSDKAGSLYGRTLTFTERDRVIRQIQVAARLGLTNVVDRDILGRGGDELDVVVNHLVLEHQAEEMGIYPTDDEVVDAIQKLPTFKGANGQYDSEKYKEFIGGDTLAPRGFNEGQLAEIVRRDIQFGKVRAIVDAPVTVSPVEAKVAYEGRYAKTNASVIRLASSDFAAGVAEPTEDEIKKYYDDQKAQFVQPEKRKVQYVQWLLTEDQKKLPPAEKNAALKTLGDQSVALLSDLLDNKTDFAAAAAKLNLTVKETPEFEQNQTAGLPEANIPGFVDAAYQLTKDEPVSNVPLQTPDGFYDLHLSGVTPVRPQTLDEARTKVVKAIKDERTRTAMNAKAEEIRAKLEEALKAGKSFADAAKEAGQAVQEVPAFSAAEPARTAPDAPTIAQTTQELGTGELSKFVPTESGGMLAYVRSREGVEDAKFEQQQAMVTNSLLRMKSSFYFSEWLREARDNAKVNLIPRQARSES